MELHSQLYLSNGRVSLKGGHVQLYTDIVDYISWRIRENFKVSEIAEYFGYNEKYITTFFVGIECEIRITSTFLFCISHRSLN